MNNYPKELIELIDNVSSYHPELDKSLLEKAYFFAADAHKEQIRSSGEPYITHPLAVATILSEIKMDVSTIIVALLHDTVEDTFVSLDLVEKEFGVVVRNLVDGVTKLNKIEFQPDKIRQAENFRKLVIAMSEDIRILLVKLADRLHNMRTLHYKKSAQKRLLTAYQTLEIYAPLAERIGVHKIKDELEDLAFSEIYPEARESITQRLEFLKKEGGKSVIHSIISHLQALLEKNNIQAEIYGREKSPYSIWKKMKRKNISFEQLSDIMAFRFIVEDVKDCYAVLGSIHSSYHMVPNRFKDYISTPKENGYSSLHTTVMGPEEQKIEIQIRTRRMHEIAELGLASHWSYKQDAKYEIDNNKYRWIRELLHILHHAASPEELLENSKMAIHHDQVFCFTPKGDLFVLPVGASAIDFAYAIHSDIGNKCIGVKINGNIASLRTQLENGDQVEIIHSKTGHPSPSWDSYVVTGKAKAEIRKFIRSQKREQYLTLGVSILKKVFSKEDKILNDKILEPILHIFSKKTVEDLYIAIGEGTINRYDVFKALFPNYSQVKELDKKSKLSFFSFKKKGNENKEKESKKQFTVPIKGLISGMAVHFAGCCHPIPGDKIVGIVNSGRGITIHTKDCIELVNFADSPERFIDVSWDNDPNKNYDEDVKGKDSKMIYIGRVKMLLANEAGTLANISNIIAKVSSNISNFKIISRNPDVYEVIVDLEVNNNEHLSNIVANLRTSKYVFSVERNG